MGPVPVKQEAKEATIQCRKATLPKKRGQAISSLSAATKLKRGAIESENRHEAARDMIMQARDWRRKSLQIGVLRVLIG